MIVYSAAVAAVAVTAAQDVFELVPATTCLGIAIRRLFIGQYSDAGDAQDEMLSVSILRGHTTSGSGGSAITPAPLDSRRPASVTTVEANNTTIAANGTTELLLAETFNVRAGWYRDWTMENGVARPKSGKLIVAPSARLVVRITAPADSITLNATVEFEEYELHDHF